QAALEQVHGTSRNSVAPHMALLIRETPPELPWLIEMMEVTKPQAVIFERPSIPAYLSSVELPVPVVQVPEAGTPFPWDSLLLSVEPNARLGRTDLAL